jgi:DNA polymerase
MGGEQAAFGDAEAASALRWWLESGVDTLVQERPRAWLKAPAAVAATAAPSPSRAAASSPAVLSVEQPATLEAFRAWLSSASDAPLASRGATPILPVGAEAAEIMLLAEPPGREEATAGGPIGGESWELAQRMLAAVGLTHEQAYLANLTCFYSPGAKLSAEQLNVCGDAARRHVTLAAPKRLLLFGDAPTRALLGRPLLEARGHVHLVEGIRTVATFHPRLLLDRPSEKARAWSDLLLLMEEPS